MPRRPTGWSCRSTCWSACASSPTLAGWNGIGFVVQAYQKRCPFVIDFIVDLARRSRPPADGAPGQGRLLGQRDQARAGRRPRRLSGLHAQGPHRRLLPGLRAPAAGRARRGVPAVRDPQRAHAGGDLPAGRPGDLRRRASTSSSACTAWASRCTSRSSATGRRRPGPAVPHLRAGRHARNAAGLPGAPPAGERRQHLVRQPHRRPGRADRRCWSRTRSRRSSAWRSDEGGVGLPHPAIPLPARSVRRRRAAIRAAWTCPTRTRCASPSLAEPRRRVVAPARWAARAARRTPTPPVQREPTPTAREADGPQPGRPRRRRRPRARSRRRRRRARAGRRRRGRAGLGRDAAGRPRRAARARRRRAARRDCRG